MPCPAAAEEPLDGEGGEGEVELKGKKGGWRVGSRGELCRGFLVGGSQCTQAPATNELGSSAAVRPTRAPGAPWILWPRRHQFQLGLLS